MNDFEKIVEKANERLETLRRFKPQAILLYSCVVRKTFWEDFVDMEMIPFQKIAPSAGFHTWGEIMRVPETGELAEEGLRKRDRILCYADGKRFNSRGLIRRLVRVDFGGKGALDTSFVSFENECILSIYDDRGCDVVFASREKYRQFFSLLSQYLLDYDLEEMKRRFEE